VPLYLYFLPEQWVCKSYTGIPLLWRRYHIVSSEYLCYVINFNSNLYFNVHITIFKYSENLKSTALQLSVNPSQLQKISINIVESRYRMYRGQFSIQKCILVIQLAENLGKKNLNLSSTIYSNLHPHLSPKNGKKKSKITKPHFPLALVMNYQGFNITIIFFLKLKNLFVIWKCFKVSHMRENASMINQS